MRLNDISKAFVILSLIITFSSCNSGGGDAPPPSAPGVAGLPNGTTLPVISGRNVMTLTVNGSNCVVHNNQLYPNKPCVSITICNPGSTTTCQTVNDMLLDTGSYGIRVFKTAIPNLTLSQVTSAQGGSLAECVKFADNTSEWGPVKMANVTMGTEDPITIPIQVIDPSFGTVPGGCGTPDANVDVAGFNGIVGVGLFTDDCPSNTCTGNHIANGRYFTCSGSSCAGGTATLESDLVQNPVSSLSTDNNGVILELPSISTAGAQSVSGYLVFGIGTESNNEPSSSVHAYTTNTNGEFDTNFNGQEFDGIVDSGSNGLFFTPTSSVPACSGTSWMCPSSLQNLSVVTNSVDQSASATVNFQISNANDLFNSGNAAFTDLGGDSSQFFDLGLPFFLGRNVYIGFESKSSTLASGTYWAY